MKIVVYTSIFGGYDELHDSDIKSDMWDIVKCTPIYSDSNRNAKKYKVLPHRYLSEYDYSIWIDGNILIINDIRNLVNNHKYQVFDHNQTVLDPRNCVYKEYDAIMQLGKQNGGNYKDNPKLMYNQINGYLKDGYPKNNGLATNPIILRNHNDIEVSTLMEAWWLEIKYGSRRDQLSFDYIAWKHNFKYTFLNGDSRRNAYFIQTGKHKGK